MCKCHLHISESQVSHSLKLASAGSKVCAEELGRRRGNVSWMDPCPSFPEIDSTRRARIPACACWDPAQGHAHWLSFRPPGTASGLLRDVRAERGAPPPAARPRALHPACPS